VDNIGMDEVLQKVEDFLEDGQQHYIVTPNPEFIVRAQKDTEFREILNQADLAVPDGAGLIFASRILGRPLKERVAGVDLMERICQKASQKKWRIFLLGGEQGAAEKTAENLKARYSGLLIEVKTKCPKGQTFFRRPTILFIALGAPKQEKWIAQNLNKMPLVKLAVGVGGAFDFISGRVKRAPVFLQKAGLEWLWRFCCQPWRADRIMNATVKFPWLIVKSKLKDYPQFPVLF